jgi:hypothetical protein
MVESNRTDNILRALTNKHKESGLSVYINADGPDVYEDKVYQIATAKTGSFEPTLILVGIRLGIDRITPAYWKALKASLQMSQSVGIAGYVHQPFISLISTNTAIAAARPPPTTLSAFKTTLSSTSTPIKHAQH